MLIGRTYRDFRLFDQARAALNKALAQDPSVRRAHYYLGTLALMSEGDVPLEEAIREFRAELKLTPDDPVVNLRLGMALADARREEAALQPLGVAARLAPSAVAFHHLGRCQLAIGRAADAITSLRRALELAVGDEKSRVRRIHYHLALALRQTGAAAEAAVHFDAAKEGSERRVDAEREGLARYLDDSTEQTPEAAARLALESPFARLAPAVHEAVARGVKTALARAYLNLGVMRAQAQSFSPRRRVFRAGRGGRSRLSAGPVLARLRALQRQAVRPGGGGAGARARHGSGQRQTCVECSRSPTSTPAPTARPRTCSQSDPGRSADPSLQYTYGLALVRSNRARDAEAVFTRMLADHGDRAEVHVILGQAHAQQGNFEAAVQDLERARGIKADVPDANATLGLIYLKQGNLAEATAAHCARSCETIRAICWRVTRWRPCWTSMATLTKPRPCCRGLLKEQPEFGDARYLLGKILLAEGEADAAVPHLEAAVRLSPEDASYHYQLAQAYRKLGRSALADRHLALFQSLKEKARGRTP